MGVLAIIMIAIGLAMDAFSVAICKGLSMKKFDMKKALIIGSYFGIFQGIMPVIGFLLGSSFSTIIEKYDHWIAFALLVLIGINMIREAFGKEDDESTNDSVDFKSMIWLAIATSIDALTVGITFSFLNVNILFAALMIGVITFILSVLGVLIGNKFGSKYEKKAQIVGGIILILMGIKILIEHLGIL